MPEISAESTAEVAEGEPFQWAIVEVFGHRRHAGRMREVEQFGAKFLRIDIPTDGDFTKGFETRIYGGAAIFSITLTDEATVLGINRPYARPAIVSYAVSNEISEEEEAEDNLADMRREELDE